MSLASISLWDNVHVQNTPDWVFRIDAVRREYQNIVAWYICLEQLKKSIFQSDTGGTCSFVWAFILEILP